MKKISNELKVGVIALVTIIAFIWLYSFLKGKNLFSSTYSYYVVYNEINGLTETNPVEINGYKAGVVESITFMNDLSGRLVVKLSVNKNFSIPENSVAEITPASLIAGMKIRLLFSENEKVYQNGDTIPGRLEISIIKKLEDELGPLKERISAMIADLDSVLVSVDQMLSPQFTASVKSTMTNLEGTTRSLNQALSDKKTGLKSITEDLSKFSAMLSENSAAMGKTIKNLSQVSDSIAAADLYTTVLNLKNTLDKTSVLLGGLNDGKGTAGQFLQNDSLYANLNSSVKSLDLLLQDLKSNPKRYVHFSVFGGGKK